MTPTSILTSTFRLQPGEALHLPLDARTTLQVLAGTVVLREPLRWLAETAVAPVVDLSPGQCHRLTEAGWVVLQAGAGGAALRARCQLTPWQRLWRRLQRWQRQHGHPALRATHRRAAAAVAVEELAGAADYSARPMSTTANTATPSARFIATM